MKLIVGLGNPGESYKKNRHNVGYVVVDMLIDKLLNSGFQVSSWQKSKKAKTLYCRTKIKGQDLELIKPQTYMNNSGFSVGYSRKKHSVKIDNIYLIHDDLDIDLGEFKIQKGKGPKVHNGVESVEKHLRSKDFWRVRIGIENRKTAMSNVSTNIQKGQDYVLQNFTDQEKVVVDKSIEKVINKLIEYIS